MPALYTIPHPYNMHQQHRQRRPHRIQTDCSTSASTAAIASTSSSNRAAEPGASLSYPIVIPPSPSPCTDATYASHTWNAPTGFEPFAWPSLWFDVPSISPAGSSTGSSSCESHHGHGHTSTSQLTDMYDTLPDLIHSDAKTPEASPVSSFRDACTTPAQDLNSSPVAICDVPLVAPRPLPFTPPAFLQFDCLPEEDEDLSFPPYTHSRRHISDSAAKQQHQKHIHSNQQIHQNPRKRPAPPPNTPVTSTTTSTSPGADAEMDSNPTSIITGGTKKRRRLTVNLTHGENVAPAPAPASVISRSHLPAGVAPVQRQHAQPTAPALFINNSGQFYFHPQLAHYTCDSMMGMTAVGLGWV